MGSPILDLRVVGDNPRERFVVGSGWNSETGALPIKMMKMRRVPIASPTTILWLGAPEPLILILWS